MQSVVYVWAIMMHMLMKDEQEYNDQLWQEISLSLEIWQTIQTYGSVRLMSPTVGPTDVQIGHIQISDSDSDCNVGPVSAEIGSSVSIRACGKAPRGAMRPPFTEDLGKMRRSRLLCAAQFLEVPSISLVVKAHLEKIKNIIYKPNTSSAHTENEN